MKILAAGGGSGGHVTPVLAVINELKSQDDTLQVDFVCDKKYFLQSQSLMKGADVHVNVHQIYAGKIRRYHGVAWYRQLLDIPTTLLNIRDFFFIAIGSVQSLLLLIKLKPNVVFTKGGFVCLPVGLMAAFLKIPYVVHDSDSHPGLTNRIISRWATRIATGAPLEYYPYQKDISKYVGIPVDSGYKPFSETEKKAAKRRLALPDIKKPMILVVGGGLGAKRLNDAVVGISEELLKDYSITHITGTKLFDDVNKQAPSRADYRVFAFISKDMPVVVGAADLVITRAGATFMAEFAAAAKPTIIVPNAMLSGGHQLKNADVFAKAGAAEVISETVIASDRNALLDIIKSVMGDAAKQERLSKRIHELAKPDAAIDTAALIVEAAATKQK